MDKNLIQIRHDRSAKDFPYLKLEEDEFVEFAKNHREYTFFVTKIGCGIAGFAIEDIAPLFADAVDVENIILPVEFESVIL